MRIGIFLILLVCLSLSLACGNPAAENNAQNENTNQAVSGGAGNLSNNSGNKLTKNSNANSETKAENKDETGEDKADFEGTAGIIDKKNELKEVALLKEVRTGRHDGYDRAVFEFAGAEMPSYHIEYIDKPVRACGSGNVVPLAGDGWLEIRFQPANAHNEEGKPTVEKREFAPNYKIIREMKLTCDFEAVVTWVLGVSSPNRYRVLELKNPTRLAVDVKH